MHTDEHEISIARELNHHQQVVKKIRAKLKSDSNNLPWPIRKQREPQPRAD